MNKPFFLIGLIGLTLSYVLEILNYKFISSLGYGNIVYERYHWVLFSFSLGMFLLMLIFIFTIIMSLFMKGEKKYGNKIQK